MLWPFELFVCCGLIWASTYGPYYIISNFIHNWGNLTDDNKMHMTFLLYIINLIIVITLRCLFIVPPYALLISILFPFALMVLYAIIMVLIPVGKTKPYVGEITYKPEPYRFTIPTITATPVEVTIGYAQEAEIIDEKV